MKLYYSDGWQLPGQQDKKAIKVEVPTASTELAAFLNDRNVKPFPVFEAESVASDEQTIEEGFEIDRAAALAPEKSDDFYSYRSPLSASSVIAGIDAGMCAAAIRQMDGTNLAKISTALIERLAILNRGSAL